MVDGSIIKPLAYLVGFLVIVCPAVFIISRLIFGAYFKAKEKHEGGN